MALPNLWEICGLRSSPYFQDALEENSDTKSLNLFVGRQKELRQLLFTIGSSDSSRQAVAGFPGVGKTTLVQVVKAEVKKAHYCVADKYISITQEHSSDALLGQLIYGIYDAILAYKSSLAKDPAMEEACHFVEVTQSHNIGGSISVMGTGVGLSNSKTTSNPIGGLTLPVSNIIESLLKCALNNNSKGVLLHLNNLENLSEANTEKAADLLRSVRDTGLMIDGLHLIIVGPTSAVQTVINRHPQIRNIFSRTMYLKKLALQDVYKLLENRYEIFRINTNQSFQSPIDDSIVDYLYKFFRGDLRAMLKGLEDVITDLMSNDIDNIVLPIGLNEFLPAIKALNQEELEENLSSINWERILIWAKQDSEATQTRESLSKTWDVPKTKIPAIMKELIAAGVVEVLPDRVDRNIQYLLTNNARLATLPDQAEASTAPSSPSA